ncbi:MAG TPA: YceD family protein [Burkholderiaceae bacterium]|nr:YceD family protein [Burkholderiaceae bacterium]
MPTRALDPLRLDVASFGAEASVLEGAFGIAELPRLAASECSPDEGVTDRAGDLVAWPVGPGAPERRVEWRIEGAQVPAAGALPETWLGLGARATALLACQRCLRPVAWPVEVDRRFRFVAGEEAAARLDEEIEDEVLALQPALDLRALLEDEMLLALPLVPRHDHCPEPLARSYGEDELDEAAEHPFAKLALLRKDDEGDGGPDIL